MRSDKEVALFYPHPFNTYSIQLLKTAALYWDEIQFITSNEERRYYKGTPELEDEAISVGLLKPHNVHEYDPSVEKAGQELLNDLDVNPEILNNICKGEQDNERDGEKLIRVEIIPLQLDKINPDHLIYINNQLLKRGISFVPLDQKNVAMPMKLFEMYISRLAFIIAENNDAAPLTDEINCQNAALDRLIDYSKERKWNQSHLAKLSLETISIPPEVPLIDIINFKDKHRDMLFSFRSHIRELSRQVAKGLDATKKQCIIEEIIKDKILPVNEEIKAKLSEDNIAFGFSALDITQATLMGTIASRGENLLAGVGAGLISLTISLVQSLREDRHIIKDHPLGYLYRAQKKFGVNR